ncbi:unnamed protein product [Ectocarpus sp. 13 AM-2016]
MEGSTDRPRDCARRTRPIRRIRGMTTAGGDRNVWNQLHQRRGRRPPAYHFLLAMSLTLLLAGSAAAAAAVVNGTRVRAGGGGAPAVLPQGRHGENEAETAVQGGSHGDEGMLLGAERIRRALVGWGDGAGRGVEEVEEQRENMRPVMRMSNPIEEEEEEEEEAGEISTAKWVAGTGQGGAVAAAVADKSNGAPAGVAAASSEGEAWFGAPEAGAEAASTAGGGEGDLEAGMGDAFVAARGAWDGSDVQLEAADVAAAAAAAVNLRAPGVAMDGGEREGSAQDGGGGGNADGEKVGVPAEMGARVVHSIDHGKKLEGLAVDLEHGLHDQADAAAVAALAADVAAAAAIHAGEEDEGPVVDRLQEDGNGQGAGMAAAAAAVPPLDDAVREQIKYPQPAPKPPARPVKRWIKSDRPADKNERGTAVGREEEHRGGLGYGQQQQEQQQEQRQEQRRQQRQQQQQLDKDGVENRAGDAWERGADGVGFGGEKEADGAQAGGGDRPEGTVPAARAGVAAAGNETEAKSLVDAKVGLASLRTIETEVEKHVEELLGLFTAEAQGGRKYRAAAQGVQEEVEDIRSELVKLLRTLNTTDAGILGAEHEMQKKARAIPMFFAEPRRFLHHSTAKCAHRFSCTDRFFFLWCTRQGPSCCVLGKRGQVSTAVVLCLEPEDSL